MTGLGATLHLSALALFGAVALCSLLGAALLGLRGRIARLAPARRARLLLAWAALPACGGASLLALSLVPPLLALLGLGPDHCLHHDDRHLHLCFLHLPVLGASPARDLLLAGAAALASAALVTRFAALRHAARRLDLLAATATTDPRTGALVVDTDLPLALSAGVLRPRVLVSTGLLGGLPPDALDVVLAHERAHARRRDGLLRLAAEILSALHLPPVRARLLADLDLAVEEACDEEAARAAGDRLRVAQTIVAVERMFARPAPFPAHAFGGSNLAARVESLLEEAPAETRPWSRFWPVAVPVALAGAGVVHHATETLLELLVG